MFFSLNLSAQNNDELETEETVVEVVSLTSDTTRSIDEDINATDPDEYQYTAKPKNAWELGLHGGHFFIDGDIDRRIPAGYGFGLHLRKAVHYVLAIRADLFYGQAKGFDPQTWSHSNYGGGLVDVERVWDPYANEPEGWFPSHKTTYIYGALEAIVNVGNILFHKKRNKWNWYILLGLGLDHHTAMLDLLDSDGNAYSNIKTQVGWTAQKFNTKEGRIQIIKDLEDVYDGVYETEGFKKKGIFRVGDEENIHVQWITGMGISRKISNRFNIAIEHQRMTTDNDYLDGIKYRTALDQTNHNDIGHYTNVRLAINLGNLNKITEPLYWLNPLDAPLRDIAMLKKKPSCDCTDTDNDGVFDSVDQEPNTPEGCVVDTRGIMLDSDSDGIPNCKDHEPFSPPGYSVDAKGIAAIPVPVPPVTKEEVRRMVEATPPKVITKAAPVRTGCGDWFLPMIHFDLNKSKIKAEYYGQLYHVAEVMKKCPSLCITAYGATDKRNDNAYNTGLSYRRANEAINFIVTNYGIDRSRINLMYGGEDNPIVKGAKDEASHFMNRRVEFRVCNPGDYNMSAPAVNSATQKRYKSENGYYNGNKNSGY